jgi:DNA repair exonuclease SbcCD ATPase subunit
VTRVAELERDLADAEERVAAAEQRIGEAQHDAQAAYDAGFNADVSDQYEPALAFSSVVCPSCGTPVPVLPPPDQEVTDASQA